MVGGGGTMKSKKSAGFAKRKCVVKRPGARTGKHKVNAPSVINVKAIASRASVPRARTIGGSIYAHAPWLSRTLINQRLETRPRYTSQERNANRYCRWGVE